MVSKVFEMLYAQNHPDRDPNELLNKVHQNDIKEFNERHVRHLKRQAQAKKAS